MTKLERLRLQHRVPAKRGGRIKFQWVSGENTGTIVGASTCGNLRVHFDGSPKHEVHFVDPVRCVTYLDDASPGGGA